MIKLCICQFFPPVNRRRSHSSADIFITFSANNKTKKQRPFDSFNKKVSKKALCTAAVCATINELCRVGSSRCHVAVIVDIVAVVLAE